MANAPSHWIGNIFSSGIKIDAENIATITSDIIRIPTLPGDKNFAVKNIIQKLGNNNKFAQIKIVYMELIIRLKSGKISGTKKKKKNNENIVENIKQNKVNGIIFILDHLFIKVAPNPQNIPDIKP